MEHIFWREIAFGWIDNNLQKNTLKHQARKTEFLVVRLFIPDAAVKSIMKYRLQESLAGILSLSAYI